MATYSLLSAPQLLSHRYWCRLNWKSDHTNTQFPVYALAEQFEISNHEMYLAFIICADLSNFGFTLLGRAEIRDTR